ncbi:hypothetical protein [Roseateles microcysteis]|uniref:hypothetical protein n=1 Tax=Roseateles microcysteis TaxID=3119057 RepID=UPI002FE5AC46
MPCQRREDVEVFADYNQFYVQDGGINPSAQEDWTDEDVARRAKVAENVFVVCPVRNMSVPVEISLYDVAPSLELDLWDHAVAGSLFLPSGHLQIHECTGGPVLDWQVSPGHYEVAVLYAGLGSLSQDGLEGTDQYHVLLWPGKERELAVLREWGGRSEP